MKIWVIMFAFFVFTPVYISCDETPETGTSDDITIEEPLDAFVNINVIPMTGESVLSNQTVVVQGSQIVKMGPSTDILLAEGAKVYDGTRKYLMPGLADMHMHTLEDWTTVRWPVSPFALFLANGVTTVRDLGPHGRYLTYVNQWRDEIELGQRLGPRFYTCGRRPGRPWEPWTDQSPAEMLQWNIDNGFDFLKVYAYLSKEDFLEVMATARNFGRYSVGHVPFSVGLETTVQQQMNEIAHIEELDMEFLEFDRDDPLLIDPAQALGYLMGLVVQQVPDVEAGFDVEFFKTTYSEKLNKMVDILHSNQVPVNTTLFLNEIIREKLMTPDLFLSRPELQFLPQDYIAAFHAGQDKHQQQLKDIEAIGTFKEGLDRFLMQELHRAAVPLILGTDTGTATMGIVPGFSIHDELRVLVDCGLTPYEAIATATVNAANAVERMSGEKPFGTVEMGKLADLVVLQENPLENIAHTRTILGVMAAGKWYPKATLDSLIEI